MSKQTAHKHQSVARHLGVETPDGVDIFASDLAAIEHSLGEARDTALEARVAASYKMGNKAIEALRDETEERMARSEYLRDTMQLFPEARRVVNRPNNFEKGLAFIVDTPEEYADIQSSVIWVQQGQDRFEPFYVIGERVVVDESIKRPKARNKYAETKLLLWSAEDPKEHFREGADLSECLHVATIYHREWEAVKHHMAGRRFDITA